MTNDVQGFLPKVNQTINTFEAENGMLLLNILNIISFQVLTNYNTRNSNQMRPTLSRTTLKKCQIICLILQVRHYK